VQCLVEYVVVDTLEEGLNLVVLDIPEAELDPIVAVQDKTMYRMQWKVCYTYKEHWTMAEVQMDNYCYHFLGHKRMAEGMMVVAVDYS
jgi:hypothetical protein